MRTNYAILNDKFVPIQFNLVILRFRFYTIHFFGNISDYRNIGYFGLLM